MKQHRRKAVSNIFVVVDGSCLPIPYIAYNFPNEKKKIRSEYLHIDVMIYMDTYCEYIVYLPKKKKEHKSLKN